MTEIIKSLKELDPEVKVFPSAEGNFYQKGNVLTYCGFDKKTGRELEPILVTATKHQLIGYARDPQGVSWSHALRMWDQDNREHILILLNAEFISKNLIASKLLHHGMIFGSDDRAPSLFIKFLIENPRDEKIRLVYHGGFHSGAFVLGDKIIGNPDERVILSNDSVHKFDCSTSGTKEEWIKQIGKRAVNNPLMVFLISACFAAPVLDIIEHNSSCGFHIYGTSSKGKTTILTVCASMYGNPQKNLHRWRTTDNGLEVLARNHNHLPLLLDELQQIDADKAGKASYLLGNGTGKTRAQKSGQNNLPTASWVLFYLSTGELSLESVMKKANEKATAGQAVRFIELPVPLDGIFNNIHNFGTEKAFAEALTENSMKFYGSIGQAWLELLVEHRIHFKDAINKIKAEFSRSLGENLPSQIGRVAEKFAIVAAAGELATKAGLTGWNEGEAQLQCRKCFQLWLNDFGKDNKEKKQVLQQVRSFMELHHSSRFKPIDNPEQDRMPNKIGYTKIVGESKCYLIATEAFKNELCKGLDFRFAISALKEAGWLQIIKDSPTTPIYVRDTRSTQRFYVLSSRIFSDEI